MVDIPQRKGPTGPINTDSGGSGIVPPAGQIDGTALDPLVVGITESGGTELSIGSIPNGTFLKRVGATIVGVAISATVAVTAPITGDGSGGSPLAISNFDLTGSYVASSPTANKFLQGNGAGNPASWVTLAVTAPISGNGSAASPFLITAFDLTGSYVASSPDANTFLKGNGAGNPASWATLTASPSNPGDNGKTIVAQAGDFTYVGGSSAGQAFIWSGSTWAAGTDFSAQNLTTTGGFIANDGTNGFLRLGLASGSGAGVASAASAGQIRGARGTNGFVFNVRNNGDTADLVAISSDTVSGPTLTVGSTSANGFSVTVAAPTAGTVTLRVGSSASQVQLANGTFAIGVGTINVGTGSATATISMSSTASATGNTLGITGQTSSAVGGTGGPVVITGGVTSGASGTRTGGFVSLISGSGQSQGGDLRFVFGTGASGATIGNISIGGTAANTTWNSMAGGAFVTDRGAAPTGNPTGGYYWWSETGGLPAWRNVAGDIVIWTLTSSNTATAGGTQAVPATVSEYMTITYKGNVRKIPLFAN